MNRGFRSGSAPTPTPPPKSSNGGNNHYIRRPTVIFNDERGGPSDKSNGAQSRVNNKFVNETFLFTSFIHHCLVSASSLQLFVRILRLIIERNLVFIRLHPTLTLNSRRDPRPRHSAPMPASISNLDVQRTETMLMPRHQWLHGRTWVVTARTWVHSRRTGFACSMDFFTMQHNRC